MTCMASLNEILFYSEPMSKGTKFWILVHFYVYNLIFTTWEFFCMYFSAKWYWWLKGLIPRIQKIHRGQIDLASMYEKNLLKKMSPFRRNGLKWTEWTRPCSISLRILHRTIISNLNTLSSKLAELFWLETKKITLWEKRLRSCSAPCI